MEINKTQRAVLKPRRSRGLPVPGNGVGKKIRSEKETVMKVVYISTPMKVKTSASKFRAIVQELTGQESDVVGIMEKSGGRDTWMVPDHDHHDHDHGRLLPFSDPDPDTSYSSVSPLSSEEKDDDSFNFGRVSLKGNQGFGGSFDDSSGLIFDQFFHQIDVMGS